MTVNFIVMAFPVQVESIRYVNAHIFNDAREVDKLLDHGCWRNIVLR